METPKPELPPPEPKTCPNCGAKTAVKVNRTGTFVACTRYPECKWTKPPPPR